MGALILVAVGFVGTFVWPVSPDAAVTAVSASRAFHPLVLAFLAAAGQALAHVLLYRFGGELRRRWAWFDDRCERVRVRHASRLRRGLGLLATSSGLLGLPPTSIVVVLAPGLALPWQRLLPLIFAMRVVRFTVLATLGMGVGAALHVG